MTDRDLSPSTSMWDVGPHAHAGVVPCLVPRGTVRDGERANWAPDLGTARLDGHAHVGAVPESDPT